MRARFSATTSLGIAVLLATTVLVGCGGGGDKDAETPAASVRPDPHPRPEGAMVYAGVTGRYGGRYVSTVRADPKTWNVLMANESSSTTFTSGPLFRGLVAFNNVTQENDPGLAERWERSEDGLTWTFHLRAGLRWSDGAPLTADDVMFSAMVLYDPVVHPSAADLCRVNGEPFRFEKVDATTVRVVLPGPYAAFLNALGSIYIMPRHRLEAAYRAGNFESSFGVDSPPDSIVTSGPWMIARHVPQERVVLKPNPYFYGFDEAGNRLPYLDELVYLVMPDQNAELLKFQSGQSDEVYFRAEDYAEIKDGEAEGGYTVHDLGMEMGTNFFWLNVNTGTSPTTGVPYVDPAKLSWFSDVRFRRALSHAVDREGIGRSIFYGMAEPLYGPIPPANLKWYNPDIAQYPYDLERARQMLEQAGYMDRDGDGVREDPRGNKISFTLLTQSDNKERQGMSNIIRDDLARIGVECNVSSVEFNTLIIKLRNSFDYDAIILGLTGGVPPDPVMSANVFKSSGMTHFWYPEQPQPATEWEAEVDQLMDAQIEIMDEEKRKEVFDRVQRIISEQQPAIYTVSRRGLLAVRNRFAGLQPSVLRPWVLWQSETVSYDPERARRELAGRSGS